ncbi:hypothetical protein ACM46_16280 [Chryseobacterium angstadtii]|uniref:Uncharacterized protein n=1 Tax=Chryseobacterium angstadtii TaxID=558151 RepID=A0A0J7I6N9_9FLAO|nr:hypothetical protein [Chryseobacterium angstadtii]KMQ61564.1 hypothetical protein ACM46_16280 [Chryseobacterium angstadtii]
MKTNSFIWQLMGDLIEEDPLDISFFYEHSMDLIKDAAIEKNIYFDNQNFGKDKFNSYTIEHFNNKEKRNLYVFCSALTDEEIFNYLDYVWSHKFGENLNKNILSKEIQFLKDKGIIL